MYQKADGTDIYLNFYAESKEWGFRRRSGLGKWSNYAYISTNVARTTTTSALYNYIDNVTLYMYIITEIFRKPLIQFKYLILCLNVKYLLVKVKIFTLGKPVKKAVENILLTLLHRKRVTNIELVNFKCRYKT